MLKEMINIKFSHNNVHVYILIHYRIIRTKVYYALHHLIFNRFLTNNN
jgi:hypothetical protein